MNLYFAVQNTVPLHANNKRSDFGLVMQFVSDLVSQIDLKTNKIKIFEYNENDTIGDPVFRIGLRNVYLYYSKNFYSVPFKDDIIGVLLILDRILI